MLIIRDRRNNPHNKLAPRTENTQALRRQLYLLLLSLFGQKRPLNTAGYLACDLR